MLLLNIVVLAGGLSPERDVSLSSGSMIANALIDSGHKVLLLDLYLGMESVDKPYESLFYDKDSGKRYEYSVKRSEPDLDLLKQTRGDIKSLIGNHIIEICSFADKVFLALHGSIGENGQLQALFDIYGISYTGTGYAGSLLAMDKNLSKILMRSNQIPTPEWRIINLTKQEVEIDEYMLPCVVKPLSLGSSVGVSIVRSREELNKALDYAKRYENRIMFEEVIEGREFSVGIIDNNALPIIEIIPKAGFYDYTNKYQAGLTEEICPARLSKELTIAMQEMAIKVHKVLQLGFYSRIDFMLKEDGSFYCLEANTLPGKTPTSLLPQEAKAVGIDYQTLCKIIIEGNKLV